MTVDNAWLHRIKAAQRDLITGCGGEEKSAGLTGYGKSTVNRWGNAEDPTIMPLGAVKILETTCDTPYVTMVMAEATGRRLTEPQGVRSSEVNVIVSISGVAVAFGDLSREAAQAVLDGSVTRAEARRMRRAALPLRQSVEDFIAVCDGIAAVGGTEARFSIGDSE